MSTTPPDEKPSSSEAKGQGITLRQVLIAGAASIIVAVIGLIGTLGAPLVQQLLATRTTPATVTPTATVTTTGGQSNQAGSGGQGNVPPPSAAASAIGIPTETIPERATAAALLQAAAHWSDLYTEPFSNPQEAATVWSTGVFTDELAYGNHLFEERLRWELQSITDTGYIWRDVAHVTPASHFAVEVETQQVRGSHGFSSGLIFRYVLGTGGNDSGYLFLVHERTKQFLVAVLAEGQLTEAFAWQNSHTISTDEANVLKVIVEGFHFTFYINGTYVDELTDTRFEEGAVGVRVDTYGQGEGVVEFDNFRVTEP